MGANISTSKRINQALSALEALEKSYEYLWQDTDDEKREQIYSRALLHFREITSILKGNPKRTPPKE